jgi:hypothetical protein
MGFAAPKVRRTITALIEQSVEPQVEPLLRAALGILVPVGAKP